jgi:hypothetical protein
MSLAPGQFTLQYFTIFEDIPEIRWQIELLYESIRLLGLEKNFLVNIKNQVKQYPHLQIGRPTKPFIALPPHSFLVEPIVETTDYEMPLTSNGTNPLVNYEKGFLPYFHKDKIFNSINFSFNMPLPFKIILEMPCIPNVVIMQNIVQSCMKFHLNRVQNLL